jgi:excisionase family DNA binding protein
LLTVDDVARITRLSKYTIRAAIREGELKASKLRGRFLIEPADLQAWIDAGRVQPNPATRSDRDLPPGGYRELVKRRGSAVPSSGPREAIKALNAREDAQRKRRERDA